MRVIITFIPSQESDRCSPRVGTIQPSWGRHVASQAPPPRGEEGRGLPRRMGRAPPRHGQQRAAQAHPGASAGPQHL